MSSLGRTAVCFSPLERRQAAWKVSPMKASPLGTNFQISPRSGFLSPVFVVHAVFSSCVPFCQVQQQQLNVHPNQYPVPVVTRWLHSCHSTALLLTFPTIATDIKTMLHAGNWERSKKGHICTRENLHTENLISSLGSGWCHFAILASTPVLEGAVVVKRRMAASQVSSHGVYLKTHHRTKLFFFKRQIFSL